MLYVFAPASLPFSALWTLNLPLLSKHILVQATHVTKTKKLKQCLLPTVKNFAENFAVPENEPMTQHHVSLLTKPHVRLLSKQSKGHCVRIKYDTSEERYGERKVWKSTEQLFPWATIFSRLDFGYFYFGFSLCLIGRYVNRSTRQDLSQHFHYFRRINEQLII